jgi:hypothetical protein
MRKLLLVGQSVHVYIHSVSAARQSFLRQIKFTEAVCKAYGILVYFLACFSAKKYVVNVVTGDVKNAGTDANVFLTIYGEQGDSGERHLQKSETNKNKFERNQV